MGSLAMRPLLQTLRNGFREFFLLEGIEASRPVLTESQRSATRAYYDAAAWRLEGARDLRDCGHERASLLLYREAALLLVWVFLGSKSNEPNVADSGAAAALEMMDEALRAEGSHVPPEFHRAKLHLAASNPMDLDRLTASETSRVAADLDAATQWLAKLVEHPSPSQLTATRIWRIVVAGGVLAGLCVACGIWAFSPRNVALHKRVIASSHAFGTTPEGAVNGKKYEPLGFHSAEEESPWLSIDLGEPHVIRRVKAYGRIDCCLDQSIPLAMEVSDDGNSYREIGEMTEEFSQWDPWVIETRSLVARFVRFRTKRNSALVLSEVEVFGRPVK